MADSIERIADEVATYQAPPNGQYIQVHPRVMRDWESRLRALSPAGGDWVMVPRKPTPEMLKAMFSGAHSYDYREGNNYRREELDDYYLSMYRNLLAASPQQEPGAVRDLTECGHSKYDPCHNCEPTTADESGPAINSAETYSKPIADPSGQTLAGAGGERDRLEDERWRLMNSYGNGPYRDGQIAQRIAEIDAKLTATSAGTTGDDSARLDFIERTFYGMTNRERYLPVQMIWGKGCNGRTLREACDKYMKRDADAARRARTGDSQ